MRGGRGGAAASFCPDGGAQQVFVMQGSPVQSHVLGHEYWMLPEIRHGTFASYASTVPCPSAASPGSNDSIQSISGFSVS